MIRLIANIAMDRERGPIIALSDATNLFLPLLERKQINQSEELVLNIIRCITNLSYYEEENNPVLLNKENLASSMIFLF